MRKVLIPLLVVAFSAAAPMTGPARASTAASGAAAGSVTGAAPAAVAADVITVDAGQQLGPLTKAGLGSLFGIASTPDTPANLAAGSMVSLSQHQSAQGDASYPTSTEAVVQKLRSSGVKMIGRYNDLMGGWPYQWKGLTDWLAKVDSATRSIQAYRDVLYAVAPFNEPDNKLQGGFATDASVPGSTYDQKFFWLWTQTFKEIRKLDPTIPIMGPNFEDYRPWEAGVQDRMRGFLTNAIATGTVPNLIGWHSLGASPGDVPEALTNYYRPLENELGVPGRPLPLVVEEYGPGTGDFEGVPGTMVKHWAEFERYGVQWASMGTYTNPGLLGNSLRRTDSGLQPNGGWYMMNWYKQMTGQRVFVSRWDTRHYQAADGVATWDQGSRTLTAIVGGEDGDVDVHVQNLRDKLGSTVRVRLETTVWEPGTVTVERGGDPQTGTYRLFDKTLTVDPDGGLTVPIHRMEGYNGYRILISAPAAPDPQPTVYEAEKAALTDVAVHNGADGRQLASGDAYVGGIDHPDSAVAFTVDAPAAGMYVLHVRYAAPAAASHTITVNGEAQGVLTYPYVTTGWSDTELRTATKRVVLTQGSNRITFGKGDGYAELDAIDVRPDTHRYEAEDATVTDARIASYGYDAFPDLVGGIDNADSSVEFTVEAPRTGDYRIEVGYGNALAAATDHVLVGGTEQTTIELPSTGQWLTTNQQDQNERRATATVHLTAGTDKIMLRKGDGYAELDYLTVSLL